MKKILAEVQSGEFAREWIAENRAGRGKFLATRKAQQDQKIEQVGAHLREMMAFPAEEGGRGAGRLSGRAADVKRDSLRVGRNKSRGIPAARKEVL